jgi:3-oxoacyl-[acyl-carrier protein] reductase
VTVGFSDLADSVVLVTGASTGIGAAVARAFGSVGARVCVHYHCSRAEAEQVAADIRASGADSWTEQADLGKPGNAAPLVQRVVARAGALHVLVNNAGHILGRAPLVDGDDAAYRRVIDLNLTSVVEACRAALPFMRAQGRGAIVNTTSVAARNGGGPGTIIYATAKGGVSTFTRGLAKEVARENIRVNAVAPGIIDTPLHQRFTPPATMAALVAAIPMGRAGSAEECAGAYLFLASNALSGYITGQILEVNGGQLMP